MPQQVEKADGTKVEVLTTQEAIDRNTEIRDKAAAWISEVLDTKDVEMLEKGRANALTQMYTVACRESERFDGILAAKRENESRGKGFSISFMTKGKEQQ